MYDEMDVEDLAELAGVELEGPNSVFNGHRPTLKEEIQAELVEQHVKWTGIDPTRQDPIKERIFRVEKENAQIRKDMEHTAARAYVKDMTLPEKTESMFPSQTTFLAENGSKYTVDWDKHLVSGMGIPHGVAEYTSTNNMFYAQREEHSVVGGYLSFELKNGMICNVPGKIVAAEDRYAEPIRDNLDNIKNGYEIHTANSTYVVDMDTKNLYKGTGELVKTNVADVELNGDDNRAYITLENGDVIRTSPVVELKGIGEQEIGEKEPERNGFVVSTYSGSKYIYDADAQTVEKEGTSFKVGVKEAYVSNLDNCFVAELEDGRTLHTSPIAYQQTLAEYDKEQTDLTKEHTMDQDLER